MLGLAANPSSAAAAVTCRGASAPGLPQAASAWRHLAHPTRLPPSLSPAEIGLTGAKLGCGEGGCGACTVMVSSAEPDGRLYHRSVNACLCPLYAVEGMHVVTVEGVGNTRDGMHPVQERLAKAHGSQCGFCTPGFVMSMVALLRAKAPEAPTEEEIEENLAGNLWWVAGWVAGACTCVSAASRGLPGLLPLLECWNARSLLPVAPCCPCLSCLSPSVRPSSLGGPPLLSALLCSPLVQPLHRLPANLGRLQGFCQG